MRIIRKFQLLYQVHLNLNREKPLLSHQLKNEVQDLGLDVQQIIQKVLKHQDLKQEQDQQDLKLLH